MIRSNIASAAYSTFKDYLTGNYDVVTINGDSNTNNLTLQIGDLVVFAYTTYSGAANTFTASGDMVEVVNTATQSGKTNIAIYELQGSTGSVSGSGTANSYALLQLRKK